MVDDDDDIDSKWPEEQPSQSKRQTVAPPVEPEPPTKPKRPTPPVLRLDSSSAFDRPDPSAVISRRGRQSLLGLADEAPSDLSLEAEPSEALDLVAQQAERQAPSPPAAPASSPATSDSDAVREMRERYSLGLSQSLLGTPVFASRALVRSEARRGG